jgi:hypothetical protein
MPRALRIAVLLLAIVATLGVSMAAESPAHFHLKQPANGCDLCFTAHLTARPAGSVVHVLPAPQTQSHFVSGAVALGYQSLQSKSSLTRGPPSLSL